MTEIDKQRIAAEDDPLYRTLFVLGDADWRRFVADLDAAPKANAKLRNLLRRAPPWGDGKVPGRKG